MQPSGYSSRSDTELAARAAAGDELAFVALYERHFESIYDFALRTVKDPGRAEDVIRSAFTKAWDRVRKRKARLQVKAWLYATARERAVRAARRRSAGQAGVPTPGSIDARAFAQPGFADVAGEPEPDTEAAEIAWQFAAGLSPKQYSLLDLHLRRGSKVDELADSLGITTANVYIMLYRLRAALAESLSTTLLSRRGRSACRELDALLSETRIAENSPHDRRIVLKHLETCSRCQASTATYPSALEVFANLAPLAARPGVRAAIWADVSDHIKGISAYRTPRTLEEQENVRRPEGAPFRPRVPITAVLAAGIASIVAILVAGILIFGTGGGGAATLRDPDDVHSPDRKTGEPSSDNTIDLTWTAIPGAKAYSTIWSHQPVDLPDTVADLPGTATSTTSPPLDPGTWYFHLRTQNEDGSWTSTLHIGPFEVIAASPTPAPTEAASPSPTQSVTPAPGPRFPTVPPATPTDSPAPTPPPTPAPPTPAPTTPPPTATPAPASETPSPQPTR